MYIVLKVIVYIRESLHTTTLSQKARNVDPMLVWCWPNKVASKHIYWPNVGLMLARRLRRQPNINPALGRCIVGPSSSQGFLFRPRILFLPFGHSLYSPTCQTYTPDYHRLLPCCCLHLCIHKWPCVDSFSNACCCVNVFLASSASGRLTAWVDNLRINKNKLPRLSDNNLETSVSITRFYPLLIPLNPLSPFMHVHYDIIWRIKNAKNGFMSY